MANGTADGSMSPRLPDASTAPPTTPAKNLDAAAELIRTLDGAFAEMSSSATAAAEDAENARRNARAASEVARRYTTRSYPSNDGRARYQASPRGELSPLSNSPRSRSFFGSDRSDQRYRHEPGLPPVQRGVPETPAVVKVYGEANGPFPAADPSGESGPSPPRGGFWNNQAAAPAGDAAATATAPGMDPSYLGRSVPQYDGDPSNGGVMSGVGGFVAPKVFNPAAVAPAQKQEEIPSGQRQEHQEEKQVGQKLDYHERVAYDQNDQGQQKTEAVPTGLQKETPRWSQQQQQQYYPQGQYQQQQSTAAPELTQEVAGGGGDMDNFEEAMEHHHEQWRHEEQQQHNERPPPSHASARTEQVNGGADNSSQHHGEGTQQHRMDGGSDQSPQHQRPQQQLAPPPPQAPPKAQQQQKTAPPPPPQSVAEAGLPKPVTTPNNQTPNAQVEPSTSLTATSATASRLLSTNLSALGKKRKNYTPKAGQTSSPSQGDRLAQSHAEDVLSLSLELERAKQSLESEKAAHASTRSALTDARAKCAQLEAQVQKLLSDLESQREGLGREADGLKADLETAAVRVQAAEEDAQLALDLAKESAESREQAEEWLQRALRENEALRSQLSSGAIATPPPQTQPELTDHAASQGLVPTPGRNIADKPARQKVVRFAAETHSTSAASTTTTTTTHQTHTVTTTTSNSQQAMMTSVSTAVQPPPPPPHTPPPSRPEGPSKAMVAAGRDLLRRAGAASSSASAPSTPDSKAYKIHLSPRMSAEKRQRLRDRLQNLDNGEVGDDERKPESRAIVPASGRSEVGGIDLGYADRSNEACRAAARMLTESGTRLSLGGRWWGNRTQIESGALGVPDLEDMTRTYCRSVELKLGRKNEEVKDLEAFCEYLERKVLSSSPKVPATASPHSGNENTHT